MKRPDEVIKILQEHDGELRTTKDGDDLVAWIIDREAKLARAEELIDEIGNIDIQEGEGLTLIAILNKVTAYREDNV